MKRFLSIGLFIIAVLLLGNYFKDSLAKLIPIDAVQDSITKVLPLDSIKDSLGKVLSLAHAPSFLSTNDQVSASSTPPSSATPLPSASPETPIVVELTKVPLTGKSESFTTLDGDSYTGVIKKVEPDGILLRTADGVSSLKFKKLPPEVGVKYGYDPTVETAFLKWRQSVKVAYQKSAEKFYASSQSTPVTHAPIGTTPVVVETPVFFDKLKPLLSAPYSGKSPHYTAIYYSAHWCGPCRAFTPELVSWYKGFKPAHPNFELIFSSCDKDEAAMQEYISLMSMPWPAFSYLKRETSLLSSCFPKGIPSLIFLDENGKLVVPNPDNNYIPPQEVLKSIERTVQ